jgi:CHASE2 domain-containing sensor protein
MAGSVVVANNNKPNAVAAAAAVILDGTKKAPCLALLLLTLWILLWLVFGVVYAAQQRDAAKMETTLKIRVATMVVRLVLVCRILFYRFMRTGASFKIFPSSRRTK